MYLYLYKNNADKRYLEKTPFLTELDVTWCELKEDSSFTDPVFKIDYGGDFIWANYCWSDDMERYYYINDVEYSTNCIYLHCHVDVLMSYRKSIKEKVVIAKRNEDKYNLYLQDDKFKAYAMPAITVSQFKHGVGDRFFNMDIQQFILCCVGKTTTEPEPEEVES